MLLLLVSLFRILNGVLADAGYHYDVPSVAFHLPSEQPANFRSGQSSSADFNKGNAQNLLSNAHLNANSGITAPVTQSYNNGHTHTIRPTGFTINSGYAQPLTRPVNLNNHYVSSATVGVQENSYQAVSTNSYNSGLYPPSEYSANSYNAFPQTLLPPLESNSNSDFTQPAGQTLNNLNVNNFMASGAANTNNGLTQTSSAADAIVSNAASAPPVPAVIKHIYFHVPPPDIEEQAATPILPPPKKTYKILFIKVPSQQTSSTARLQQLIQSQNRGVEEKTLIYVLVNKSDPRQSVVAPQPTKPNHEVFFVKYNENPVDVTSQINDGSEQTGSPKSIFPKLQPGLVNGNKWNENLSLNS